MFTFMIASSLVSLLIIIGVIGFIYWKFRQMKKKTLGLFSGFWPFTKEKKKNAPPDTRSKRDKDFDNLFKL